MGETIENEILNKDWLKTNRIFKSIGQNKLIIDKTIKYRILKKKSVENKLLMGESIRRTLVFRLIGQDE